MNAPLTKEQIELLMSDNMTVRHMDVTVAAPRPGLFARVSDAMSAWLERRAVLAELHNLSDRELTDIGLSRSDLGRVFDHAFVQTREQAVRRAANA